MPLNVIVAVSGSLQFLQKGHFFNTLRPRQMDAISQTTFSNAFSWMKMFEFRLKFHWSLFLRYQLTIFQHWFRYWLGAVQATSLYLNQWWLVYWRIYVSLGLNELTHWGWDKMAAIQYLQDIFKFIFWYEDAVFWFGICSQGSINSKSTVVQIMAGHQTGNKPWSEPMMACC